MNRSIAAFGCIAILLTCLAPLCGSADAAPADGFDITDGTGRTFHYVTPAEHIVVQGSAVALTIGDVGAADKIVAVDKYSTYAYTGYEVLKDMDAFEIKTSFYSGSGSDAILADIVNLVEQGRMTRDDTIILTSYSANASLRTMLEDAGFTHVLLWLSIGTCDDIVSIVESVSMVATGSVHRCVEDMAKAYDDVRRSAEAHTGDAPKALYVWYSSGFKVGNTGIMKSMLDLAGADNIGYDASNTASSYGDRSTIVSLLEQNPGTVVFVNNAYFKSKTLDDFYEEMFGGDRTFKVVQMGLHWNNYCPESAEGLTEIYKALYDSEPSPQPESGSGSGSDAAIYLAIAAAVGIAAAAGAILLIRARRSDS